VRGGERQRWLAAAYDPVTTRRLIQAGVAGGWHCLDAGSGGGSIARWLAGRVTPTGTVLATDTDVTRLRSIGALTARQHDLSVDPLPPDAFDLVHARFVLGSLPDRAAVLATLISALKPGGLLQVGELDPGYAPVLAGGDPDERERFRAAVAALPGGDWVAEAVRAAGLVELDVSVHVEVWHSGSPGLRALGADISDPDFRATACPFYTVQGRRPR
jgi:SAM-dependent methyltransferase